jgi:hypothetical protein
MKRVKIEPRSKPAAAPASPAPAPASAPDPVPSAAETAKAVVAQIPARRPVTVAPAGAPPPSQWLTYALVGAAVIAGAVAYFWPREPAAKRLEDAETLVATSPATIAQVREVQALRAEAVAEQHVAAFPAAHVRDAQQTQMQNTVRPEPEPPTVLENYQPTPVHTVLPPRNVAAPKVRGPVVRLE